MMFGVVVVGLSALGAYLVFRCCQSSILNSDYSNCVDRLTAGIAQRDCQIATYQAALADNHNCFQASLKLFFLSKLT